jgi:hypothetical protein
MRQSHLLITGASGRVGRAFLKHTGRHFKLRLADTKPISPIENAELVNRYKRLAIERTRNLLGYAPVDDAFEILGIPGGPKP